MKKKLPLYSQIIIGLLVGIAYAILSSFLGWNTFTIRWIDPFGLIFVRLLKLIAVPLVLFSIICGISNISNISKLGKMGVKTIALYLLTTALAVTLGVFLTNTIQPGNFIDQESRLTNRLQYEKWATTNDIPLADNKSFADDNISRKNTDTALQNQAIPNKLQSKMQNAQNMSESKPLQFLVDMVPENIAKALSSNQLMLQVIFFALLFGISLALIPKKKAKPIIKFFNSINEVFIKMVEMIMRVAPYFVFALMAGVLAKMANTPNEVFQIFRGLGVYVITVLLGLAIMILVIYPLILLILTKKFAYKNFYSNILPAQLMAFSTSSSAATLPITMKNVKENLGVSNDVASFVLPVGATANMDGSSLLQAVACVFLAQLHFIDLNFAQQLTIILTAVLASIGTAAIPSAALVMLIIVLEAVGLNPAWIAIIFPVDRILDMCRTVVNVTGDTIVCYTVAKTSGEKDKESKTLLKT